MLKIFVDGTFIATVKVPNEHTDTAGKGLVSRIAKQLRLTRPEFDEFVGCRMKRREYHKLLLERECE